MTKKQNQVSESNDLRKKAEKIAQATVQIPGALELKSPEDVQRIIHELLVHQIELEMQNDELHRTQIELEHSRARYFDLYDLAPNGYCTISATGIVLESNLTACSLLGVPRRALVNQPFSRFMIPKYADIYYLRHKKLFKTHEPQTCDLRMKKEDGAIFWIRLTAAISEKGDSPVARVVFNDITEQKFIDEEHEFASRLILLVNSPGDFRQLMSALTASLKRWSGFDAVGIRLREGDDFPYYQTSDLPPRFIEEESHLCVYDQNGEAVRDDTGKPILECMCGNVIYGRVDPDKPFFTANGSFWTNNTSLFLASTTEKDRESRTINRCNKEGYESVALIPLRDGKKTLGLLHFNDHKPDMFTPEMIAHFERLAENLAIALGRRQAEEKLQEAFDAANAANIAKSEFLSTMSHEIRTPLNGILGFCSILSESLPLDDLPDAIEYKEEFALITQCGVTLLDIINDILELSKIESGKFTEALEEFSPVELLQGSVDAFKFKVTGKDLSINFIANDLPETVIGEQKRLKQICFNLIGNAVKFTDHGSITLSADYSDEKLNIRLKDTGIGIPQDKIKKLGEPFYQVNQSNTRKFGGTGLGLSIVKRLLDKLGGSLKITSQLDEWTEINVSFPVSVPQQTWNNLRRTIDDGKKIDLAEHPIVNVLNILVLEDDHVSALYIKRILDGASFNYRIAESFDKMQKICSEDIKFDIVLIDISLPGASGFECLKWLREKNSDHDTKYIVQSANVLKDQKDQYIKAGFDDFIGKPYTTQGLLDIIHKNI